MFYPACFKRAVISLIKRCLDYEITLALPPPPSTLVHLRAKLHDLACTFFARAVSTRSSLSHFLRISSYCWSASRIAALHVSASADGRFLTRDPQRRGPADVSVERAASRLQLDQACAHARIRFRVTFAETFSNRASLMKAVGNHRDKTPRLDDRFSVPVATASRTCGIASRSTRSSEEVAPSRQKLLSCATGLPGAIEKRLSELCVLIGSVCSRQVAHFLTHTPARLPP